MKSKLIALVLTACLHACTTGHEGDTQHMPMTLPFRLAPALESITDSFLIRHPHWKHYDLFINRITDDSTVIILSASNHCLDPGEYQARFRPSAGITRQHQSINVYAGMERYVAPNGTLHQTERKYTYPAPYDFANWVIFCSKDTMRVDTLFKDFPIAPFAAYKLTHEPAVRFTAPTILEPN